MLPETIRVIAWSPVPSTFSARFSCRWRHYKYFFSPQNLDISLMEDASSRLVGEHDFRNLCKLDAAKQITSFKRNVLSAHIEQLNNNLHVFNLVGSAFLYHQVRHIMAVLFLVGTGLEPPSLVSSLLNVSGGAISPREGEPSYPVVDRKPEYQMADGLPLMLWDCGYPDGTFTWRTTGRPENVEFVDDGEVQRELQNIVTRSHIHAALNEHFLLAMAKYHASPKSIFPLEHPSQLQVRKKPQDAIQVPLGGGTSKRVIKYPPVLERKRLDHVDVANERWRLGKGFRKSERRRVAEENGGTDDT
jgi:tRNA pseudouridine38/39 synthase